MSCAKCQLWFLLIANATKRNLKHLMHIHWKVMNQLLLIRSIFLLYIVWTARKRGCLCGFPKDAPSSSSLFCGMFFGVSFVSRKVVKPIFTWFFRREPAIVDIMWRNKSRRFVGSLFSVWVVGKGYQEVIWTPGCDFCQTPMWDEAFVSTVTG